MINSKNINNSRKNIIDQEFQKDYFKNIISFLNNEEKKWSIIYPEQNDIFNAFNKTSLDYIKVVILWQDPYHGKWEAHWLCFSVQNWIKIPPSLKNIFKELEKEIDWFRIPQSWNLTSRANQWVFLLNSTLTVEKDKPASHKDIWRQIFTDNIIKTISDNKDWVIFLLRGAHAQSKESLIDNNRHYILKCPHPSPFSARKWFFWSRHFIETNNILSRLGKQTINRAIIDKQTALF